MSVPKVLTALAFLSITTSGYAACDGVWQTNTAGDWFTAGAFQPCTPNMPGDTATFGTPPKGPVAVNVSMSPNITGINFQNSNPYTLSGNDITTSFIHVAKGAHTIENGVNCLTDFTFTADAGSSVDLRKLVGPGPAVFNGPGTASITNPGPLGTTGINLTGMTGNLQLENQAIVTVTNAASVDMAIGYQNTIQKSLIVNNGTFNLFNTGTLHSGSSQTLGNLFVVQGGVVLNSGKINLINYGTITSEALNAPGDGVVLVINQPSFINGGTFLLENFGNIDQKSGGAAIATFDSINITGGSLINNGTIACNGDMMGTPGTINVGQNGTLAGNGIFTSGISAPIFGTVTINNDGTLMPGDPNRAGTMFALGTLNQSSTAIFRENIITGNNYGQFVMSVLGGSGVSVVNLAGSLEVSGLPGFNVRPGDTFTIIRTLDAVNGTFASVSMLNNRSYIPMVFYSPKDVILVLNAGSFPGIQQSLFTSINNTNIRLEREMQHLRSRFPQQESGSTSSTAKASTYYSPRERFAAISVSQELKPSKIATQMQTNREQQRVADKVRTCDQKPFNVYFGPIGTIADYNTKKHQVGFSEWSAGALLGFDYAGENAGVGLQVEYERQHGHGHKHWGNFNLDQAHADLFATYVPSGAPKLALNGIVGGGYDWIRVRRNTGFTGSTVATGTTHASEFDALFGLEYTIDVKKTDGRPSNIKFIPMVNIQYIYLNIDGYREHSAGIFDLSISGQKPESLRSTLGAWITDFWEWDDLRIDLELDAAWQREYLDHGKKLSFVTPNFAAPSGSMTAVGAGRNSVLAGLDLLFTMHDKYGIEASYDFQWNNLFTDNAFYLGFNVKF